ncbi:UNVERIFIED_ORG: hypothetical protein J2W19_001075 [Shinella zoogloeoides]|nr:hypothetical protein [Shinella zoogloeoides]
MRSASELANRLARNAEAVCRHYLSAGRRAGNYWIVGDTANNKGRSLYVQLTGPRAGRWTDAATAEYGDLLDLIRETSGLVDFRDVAEEARRFLSLPRPAPATSRRGDAQTNPPVDRPANERARRLFSMAQSLEGTLAESYLRQRGILRASEHPALRYHQTCYYRDLATGRTSRLPALLAAVTDTAGTVTGVHRTWLDAHSGGKAPVDDPRRALGSLLGNAVRFGFPAHGPVSVMTAGEGLESTLSLVHVMPKMPMVSALTANHLAAFDPPPGCLRLYIAADADDAGRSSIKRLSRRAQARGILPLVLRPDRNDFNDDLLLDPRQLITSLRAQLAPEDADLFLPLEGGG